MPAGPIIISIFMFACIVIIWGGAILARHRERMTMMDKGLKPEDIKSLYERGMRPRNPRAPLMWGIVLTAVGLAGLIGMALTNWYHLDDGVIPGLMALFAGIGFIAFYAVTSKSSNT